MPGMSDDEHISFALLFATDAMQEQDDAKAHAYLLKAQRHAYAVLNRNKQRSEEEIPETCVCPVDGRPDCGCASVCRCDFRK